MNDLDSMNDKYFAEAQSSINSLIDLKVALHEHDKILDDQIDDFKARIVSICFFIIAIGYGWWKHFNHVSLGIWSKEAAELQGCSAWSGSRQHRPVCLCDNTTVDKDTRSAIKVHGTWGCYVGGQEGLRQGRDHFRRLPKVYQNDVEEAGSQANQVK
jgi:hypothetical protein